MLTSKFWLTALAVLVIAWPGLRAQTNTFPALATDNVFTGNNTFTGAHTLKKLGDVRIVDSLTGWANIQAAITDAGTTGSVWIMPSYAGTDTYTNPNNINIIDRRGRPDRYKGFINVVSDCGAKGDGVTDDYAAISTCLTNNPGAHFLFPKMCVQSGSFSCVDFLDSQSLTLGPNQWLDGVTAHYTNNKGTGAPVIKWSVDTTGIIIPVASVGAHISNLELKSSLWPSGRWSDSDLTTWPQNSSSDGIYVGATAVIENVDIDGFSRHGINVDGSQNGQQPDLWKVRNVRAGSLGGDGLFLHGGDANAGFSEGMSVYTSNGWGIRDNGNLGNTHIQPHTNGVHRNAGVAAGSTVNISSIAVAANVASVTTATNHGFSVGSWVTVAGTTNFNGTVKVITVPTVTTFTYNFVSSAASEATGTVKKESGLNVYANALRTVQKCSISSGTASLSCTDANFYDDHQPGAAITVAGAGAAGANLVTTIVSVNNGYNAVLTANASTTVSNVWATVGGGWGGGPYNASQPSTTVTWINMYQEGNQPVSKLASGSIVVGNNAIGNFDFTYGKPLILQAGSTGEIDAPAGVFRFKNNTDALFNFILQSGVASAQETDLIFYDNNGTAMHSIRANFGGGASGQLDFRDDRIGNIWLAGGGSTNAGTFLRANGSGALDLMSTGTGNMTVFGGSGANGTTFTNAGATTFSKQIISSLATGTAPLSIASTTLVPNLNTQVLNGVTVSGAAASGNVLTASSSSAASWQGAAASNFAWGGDGSDGSITADGSTTLTCLGAPAANVYTLLRSCFFTALTVNSGVTIKTNNFELFVQGTLTNAGNINNDGLVGNAGANSLGSAGGGGGAVTVAAGASNNAPYTRLLVSVSGNAGGAGNTGAGSQAPAANAGNGSTTGVDSSGVAGAIGSSGGKGGDGNPNAGGALRTGGAAGTIGSIPGMSGHHQNNAFWGGYHSSAAPSNWSTYCAPNAGNGGAPGGGGGGGDGTNAGGGGGGGGGEGGYGGLMGIFAKSIVNSGTISSNGGTGGAGGNGRTAGAGNTGGGGGGAGGSGGIGGIVWLVYQTISNTGTISANGGGSSAGGAKGLPFGTGVDNATAGTGGPVGPAGIVIQIVSQ